MAKHQLGGIYTALLTPFDKNGKINDNALVDLINMNLKKGVTGFYVNGSTAESFLLTEAERAHVYELVAQECRGKAKLIAQVGAIATDQAIGWARLAEKLGYDAISSVSPFYFKFSADEVKKYYFDIVNEVSLPMIVYHIPAFSGVALGAAAFEAFLTDDRFAGVKYTATDYFLMEQIKTAFPDKVIYNGYDETFLAGLSMGADGGIGSTYNFMADKYVKIKALFEENKIEQAQALQREVNFIITLLVKYGVMPAEKEILNQLGLDFGECRRPFSPVSDEGKRDIAEKILPLL
jgi:N-acetylneuraminate lyase